MSQEASRKTNRALLVNLAWATALGLMLAGGYVASYPIALRATQRIDMPAYRPVQYLIDETPLDRPIIWWSRICGAGQEAASASIYRTSLRDI
jgi:hypothetical protein